MPRSLLLLLSNIFSCSEIPPLDFGTQREFGGLIGSSYDCLQWVVLFNRNCLPEGLYCYVLVVMLSCNSSLV